MTKSPVVPLSNSLLSVKKGEAVPLSIGMRSEAKPQLVETTPALSPAPPPLAVPPQAKPPKPVDEPLVHHNFKVKKSFKRAFDQAAFDADMKNVEFLQHVFAFYRKHHRAERG